MIKSCAEKKNKEIKITYRLPVIEQCKAFPPNYVLF